MDEIQISKPVDPNIDIWIADNVSVRAVGKYSKWNRFWLKLFLGWKVTDIIT